jgi:hypothetical protein
VIFNDGGVLAGDSKFLWDKNANRLDVDGPVVVTGLVTAGSATITGALTVDTTTLVANAAGYTDKVGIGTATPTETLEVKGTANFYNTSGTYVGFKHNVTQVGYIGTANAFITGGATTNFGLSAQSALVLASGASAIERLKVEAAGDITISTGNVVMATSGKGIDFSAVTGGTGTATANVLNDYEEGIWDASFITGGGTVTINPAVNRCRYTKIGRLVTVNGLIQVSSVSSPTGPLLIAGLPFTIPTATEGDTYSAASLSVDNLEVTATGQIVGYGSPTSTNIYLYRYQAGVLIGLAPSAKASSEFVFTFTSSV